MKNTFVNALVTLFLAFVITSFLLLNTMKTKEDTYSNEKRQKKQEMYLYLYDFITLMFLMLLAFLIAIKGYFHGIIEATFIWVFFVIATPIPESGLLVSLPLKRFFGLNMAHTQIAVSIAALITALYLYYNFKTDIGGIYIGRVFDYFMKNRHYSIIIVSIVCSILGSELIDNYIDKIVYLEDIEYLREKLIALLTLIVAFVLLLVPYVNRLIHL
jgi:cation transport ATPase